MSEPSIEPIIAKCPECGTRFRVTEEQLEVARGRVRCGACLSIFQAREHLVWADGSDTQTNPAASLDEVLSDLEGGKSDAPEAGVTARDDAGDTAADADDLEDYERWLRPDEGTALSLDDIEGTLDAEDASGANEHGAPGATESSGDHDAVSGIAPEMASSKPSGDQDDTSDHGADTEEIELTDVEAFLGTGTGATGSAVLDALVRGEADGGRPDDPEPAGSTIERAAGYEAFQDTDTLETVRADTDEYDDRGAHGATSGAQDSHKGVAEVLPRLDEWDILDLVEDSAGASGETKAGRRWLLLLGSVIALVVLVAQVFWFRFDSWAKDPALRDVYGYACELIGCELPEMRSVQEIGTEELVVRSHPTVNDALMVDAIIINRAAYPQAFPIVELRFSEVGGKLVAGRRFQPEEYLAGELAGATQMAPNTPIHIAFEIEDPGEDAVNYIILFR